MVKVIFVAAGSETRAIEAPVGESLMRVAKNNGIEGVVAECGGSQVCGTCLVYVREPWFSNLPPPNDLEAEMVEYAMHPHPQGRLSCQIELTQALDGMVVETPPSQR